MDELLHHCLRELSFDGDLGCNVSRLRDFIAEFYAHTGTPQTPDDALCAFVWSLVVQQPTVRVGTIPPGVLSEVWIAPQTSAKRKAKAKGQEHIETIPTELDLVPDAKSRTLDDLKREYGDDLRIAVDPDAIYAAITGSHIRFAKLSPMVYSALQIITRGRDSGITVVGLGQKSKYDQKTCFYLVRQLTDLDLVVKVRRGGVGTHFCIHKYFFDRSPSWKAIRDEEIQAENSHNASQHRKEDLVEDEEDKSTDLQSLDFSPIDARHLSSLPLIRARVVKLLKASRNQIHASNNMLITLGFSNPTKTDRRFFQSRIREMIQQGLIEKVVVPSNRKKSINASVKCFRLVSKEQGNEDGIVVQTQDGDDDEKDFGEQSGIKMNITIHKQIIDLLEESDTTGMTLNELSAALCQFDKRTIELLLTRAEKFPPPSHLSDLGIAGLMETSGRERRHRYYTVASYRKLIAKENLDNSTAGFTEVDFTNVGGFHPCDPSLFYSDDEALFKYQDVFKELAKEKNGKARKQPLKNPILPDGTVKQGRPRKDPVGKSTKAQGRSNKRKRDEIVAMPMPSEGTQPTKRRRLEQGTAIRDEIEDDLVISGKSSNTKRATKKHGRPLKEKPAEVEVTEPQASKKRGRPRKVKPNTDDDTPTATKRSRRLEADNHTDRMVSPTPVNQDQSSQIATGASDMETGIPDAQLASPPQSISEIQSCLVTTLLQPRPLSQGSDSIHESAVISSKGLSTGIRTDTSPGPRPILPHSPGSIPRDESSNAPQPPIDYNLGHLSNSSSETPGSQQPNVAQDDIPIDPVLIADVLHETQRNPAIAPSSLESSQSPGNKTSSNTKPTQTPFQVTSDNLAPTDVPGSTSAKESKQKKPPRGARVNVSHLRRENELYRVIENMGGIVNIQTKEFFEGHMSLLETMTRAGEATSAPAGTRTDKRTAVTTINNMEMRGRVKQLRTAVMTHTGVLRPACIVYMPTTDQDKLNAFLADLANGTHPTAPHQGSFVKIDEHVEYGADPTSVARGALPLQLLQLEQPSHDRKERWSKNLARAGQLFSYDDAVIRDVLLTERTTLGQLYGFIVGKVVRARELHLSTLTAFEARNSSTNIISHDLRILDISFFCHDIPLGLYCSLVSSLSHDEELTQFLSTDEGRYTLVRDIPPGLSALLQVGRSRARSRFLDILDSLRALNLVTPLQASTSSTPWISCPQVANRPCAFDVAPLDGWTINTPMAAPLYWLFNDTAPIHIWAASEVDPPFWKHVTVASSTPAMEYWRLLQQACTTVTTPNPLSPTGATASSAGISVARSLRRSVSWNPDYILTWHQKQYLKQFMETPTAKTPLQDEDGGNAQIGRISWIISAPQSTIRKFFELGHEKLLKEMERARRRADNHAADKRAKRAAAAKASLAKKAAEARVQREGDWEALILRLHPGPLEGLASIRVRRVKARFLQAGSAGDIPKWEAEVAEALREADIAAKKVLKVTNKRNFSQAGRTIPVPLAAPPPAANPPEKSIQTLIAQQGPPIVPRQDKVKRKRKEKEKDTNDSAEVESKPKVLRRHRFQWNRDYEELARDASAIIKARCRNLPRLDWAAFEQVFPAVPRNTVRQRLAHIKEIPGNEAYLNRLEDRWYDLWLQHRGTPLLPDDDPLSTNNFNLIKHIEFLRQHVDKNALRVGFAQPRETAGTKLPASLDQLLSHYDIVESTPAVPAWDFMWNAIVEEGREKRLMRQPFLRGSEEMPYNGDVPLEGVSLGEAAMKMTLGTPNERYDPEPASTLLRSVGEQLISPAIKNLLNRGVLSKLVRDPQKQKPGRQLKISEVNQNAIGGSLSRDTFQDAAVLEDISVQDDTWREWPLLATDGDCAALVQLVSDGKVEFRIDTSHAQLARQTLDWNSKKADDDQIETAIHIRIGGASTVPTSQSLESSPIVPSLEIVNDLPSRHGISLDGDVACCKMLSGARISDCVVCLETEWASFNDGLDEQERAVASQVLTIVRHSEERGVTKRYLQSNVGVTSRQLFSIIRKMTESPVPLLFWGGYFTLVLVSSAYIKSWTVVVSESPLTRIFPRRWYDISGLKIVDFWEAALRAVIGVIIFRPGVSQAELRWRLRSVYDRQEVNDLVRYLHDEGFVNVRCESWVEDGVVGVLDETEEKGVFWFIGEERHWYQMGL